MTSLRVARTHYPVTALGPGRRLGVWVQGCPLGCPGCMSRDTWDPGAGVERSVEELAALWARALADGARGLTVSGGEPLAQPAALAAFLAAVRTDDAAVRADDTDILLYTGYDLDELDDTQLRAAGYADVLITGRYEAGRPTRLIWRGSANQQMVIQTPLGAQRYAEYEDAEAERAPMQVTVDDDGDLLMLGVPPPGTLSRLDGLLRGRGVRLDRRSWITRGPGRTDDAGGSPPR